MATKQSTEKTQSVFEVLNSINVNGHTEKKNDLTYLSWIWAWGEIKKRFPSATYTIYKDEQTHLPYIESALGIMCYTSVTIEGETLEMWLPVMDASKKAMKSAPYSYKSYNRSTKTYEDKWVSAATMFDINTTIMRCLAKNIAMFGLGYYIYAGEDIPESEKEMIERQVADLVAQVEACKTREEVQALWAAHPEHQVATSPFYQAVAMKNSQL